MDVKDYKECGWVDIKGYKMRYRVNCTGEIQYYDPLKNDWITKKYRRIGNYNMVRFSKKSLLVHRLVALAFIENPENKATVDHIDGNKECNCCGNLRWLTLEENIEAYEELKKGNQAPYTCTQWGKCEKTKE